MNEDEDLDEDEEDKNNPFNSVVNEYVSILRRNKL